MGDLRFALDAGGLSAVAELAGNAQGLLTAAFAGCDREGRFMVRLPGLDEAVVALSVVSLAAEAAGESVLVALDVSGLGAPVILGRLHQHVASAPVAHADGERLVLSAEREIELRCGDASIVLTRAGKVLIRGTYVASRSKGANKIKGAYVDIN